MAGFMAGTANFFRNQSSIEGKILRKDEDLVKIRPVTVQHRP